MASAAAEAGMVAAAEAGMVAAADDGRSKVRLNIPFYDYSLN